MASGVAVVKRNRLRREGTGELKGQHDRDVKAIEMG